MGQQHSANFSFQLLWTHWWF